MDERIQKRFDFLFGQLRHGYYLHCFHRQITLSMSHVLIDKNLVLWSTLQNSLSCESVMTLAKIFDKDARSLKIDELDRSVLSTEVLQDARDRLIIFRNHVLSHHNQKIIYTETGDVRVFEEHGDFVTGFTQTDFDSLYKALIGWFSINCKKYNTPHIDLITDAPNEAKKYIERLLDTKTSS